MKILVAIANYGVKNAKYIKLLIQEYRSMPFDVDIVILSETQKDYGRDVAVLVGLPSKDPWSLPFGHKKLFADNIDKYDLFVYTEDDTLIQKANILAFLKASEILEDKFIPGFMRYELYPNGKKNYPEVHGHYHWVPSSVRKIGDYIFAEFTNAHSACYILTQIQLRKALASGGFLVEPHSGRYDLLCSAATDPYTQCGFTKVLCLSHLQDFELHHLPNVYLNRIGLDEGAYKLQIEAILEILNQKRTNKELFSTEKTITTSDWDKSYYEPRRNEILRNIPLKFNDILSIGCGWGETESYFLEKGSRIVAIPLDSVIGRLAEERGITVLPPDFEQAFEIIGTDRFDVIILSDVLQHLLNPLDILSKLRGLLKTNGVIVGSVPNLSHVRRLTRQLFLKNSIQAQIDHCFSKTHLNLTNVLKIKNWLKASQLCLLDLRYEDYSKFPLLPALSNHLPGVVAASNIVFVAEQRSGEEKKLILSFPIITKSTNKQQIGTAPRQRCALCNSNGEFLYSELQDRLFGAVGSWDLAKCCNKKCGLVWIDPMPSAEDIEKAYKDYYTHKAQETVEQIGILQRMYQWMKCGYLMDKYDYPISRQSVLIKTFGKFLYLFPLHRGNIDKEVRFLHALPQGRLLDIGCGSGEWLLFMRELGWQVEGLDFDENAVNVAKQRGLQIHYGSLEMQNYPNECFDVITINHVIEHIPNPVATLIECRRMLKRRGKLILVTPNIASFGHHVLKRFWRGLEPPRHLYLFCPSSMKSILALSDFDEFTIRTMNSNYIWKHSFKLYRENGELGLALRLSMKIAPYVFSLIEQFLLIGNPEVGECLVVEVFKK